MSTKDDDQITCEVQGCNEYAEYCAPGDWCKKHWDTWWNWPEEKPEPSWMK